VRHTRRWLGLGAVLALLVLGDACVRPAASPPPALTRLIQSYEGEVAPYYPFAASERGARQYDRVLANDIGADYSAG
jgi:hypothetical protein